MAKIGAFEHETRPATPVSDQRSPIGALAWALMISLSICLLASISLDQMGLRVGSAQAYFARPRPTPAAIPALEPGSIEPLPGTTIIIWFLKRPRFFSADTIFANDLSRGRAPDGRLAYHIAFDEAGFNRYMSYWFFPTDQDLEQIVKGVRSPHIDLLPGGLTLYADLQVGPEWKQAGLLYELDGSGTQLNFRGIQFAGETLTAQPDSLIDHNVGQILERLANRALRELTFIDDSGAHLAIQRIVIGDDSAEVLAVAQ
jgi:hypothetical protein